jgi:hypothetical protein
MEGRNPSDDNFYRIPLDSPAKRIRLDNDRGINVIVTRPQGIAILQPPVDSSVRHFLLSASDVLVPGSSPATPITMPSTTTATPSTLTATLPRGISPETIVRWRLRTPWMTSGTVFRPRAPNSFRHSTPRGPMAPPPSGLSITSVARVNENSVLVSFRVVNSSTASIYTPTSTLATPKVTTTTQQQTAQTGASSGPSTSSPSSSSLVARSDTPPAESAEAAAVPGVSGIRISVNTLDEAWLFSEVVNDVSQMRFPLELPDFSKPTTPETIFEDQNAFTKPRFFQIQCPLKDYLQGKCLQVSFQSSKTTLNAVLTGLKEVISREKLYDPQNACIVVCDSLLEFALNVKSLHISEVKNFVLKRLVTAVDLPSPWPDRKTRHPPLKRIFVPEFPKADPKKVAVPVEGPRPDLSKLNSDTQCVITPDFKKALLVVAKEEMEKCGDSYSYCQLTKWLSAYILHDRHRFFDERNIKVCNLPENDPLAVAFALQHFHRTQVTSLLHSQIVSVVS